MHRLIVTAIALAWTIVLAWAVSLVRGLLVVPLPIFVEFVDAFSTVFAILSLGESLFALWLAISSLEFVRAASDGNCQLYGKVLVLVILLLLLVQVHQIDHVAFIAVSFLSLRNECVLEVLLVVTTLAADFVDLIHVVTVLIDDLGLRSHACSGPECLRVVRLGLVHDIKVLVRLVVYLVHL